MRRRRHLPALRPSTCATEFSFTVDAPFDQVVPLFGADEERKWAPRLESRSLSIPRPARDQQGMVFKLRMVSSPACGSTRRSIWLAGHIQYAYVLSDAMAVLIDIHATRQGANKTGVTVVYERTALMPEANEHVQHFAKGDAGAGKEWGDAINEYFAKLRSQK